MSTIVDKSTKFYLVNGDKKICYGYSIQGVENNRKKRISWVKQHIKMNESSIARLDNILKNLNGYNLKHKGKTPLTADKVNKMIETNKDGIERMNKYIDVLVNAKIVHANPSNTMPFEQALVLLKQGKKIRRKAWPDYYYIYLTEDKTTIRIHDRTCTRDFSAYELLQDDWEVAHSNIEDLVPDYELPEPLRKKGK